MAGRTLSGQPERARRALCSHSLGVLSSSVLSLLSAVAAAQSDDPRPQRASLAYFGERAVQPGARIGYDAAAWLRRPHELLLAGQIGGFAVPDGYALLVLFEGGYRLTLDFGGFIDLRPGLGYTAAWISTGQAPPTVSNYLTLSGLGGIGYDFFRQLRVPISVMARSGVMWRSGTGPLEGVSYALDVGIAYQFGTSRPKPITLPIAMPPPAEAPANLDEAGRTEAPPAPTAPAEPSPGP